jgi:2-methylisocitrate lyase-like PEP mutase family enzyme
LFPRIPHMTNPAERLRTLLAGPDLLVMPCCFDALSARLIERAGFP